MRLLDGQLVPAIVFRPLLLKRRVKGGKQLAGDTLSLLPFSLFGGVRMALFVTFKHKNQITFLESLIVAQHIHQFISRPFDIDFCKLF